MIPINLKKYFWEVDTNKLDFKKYPEYTAGRILEYGDIKANRWLLKHIDKKIIRKVLLKSRDLSLQSRVFWSLFFNIPKQCLRKFYQAKQKNLWPY